MPLFLYVVLDIDSGIYGMFFEPMDFVTEEPNHFTREIAKGSLSLVKHTIHGISNSTSKVTESIGNGISILSMDSEYLRERNRNTGKKPKNFNEGIVNGIKVLSSGIISGATGIFTKPMEGVANEGLIGFVKGIGKGIVGIPVKPAAAMFDFVHNTTAGLRSITSHFDKEDKIRSRAPRVFLNGVLSSYDSHAACGQEILYSIADEYYYQIGETYKSHVQLHDSNSIVLLTQSYIIMIKEENLSVEWSHKYSDFFSCALSRDGCILVLKVRLDAQQKDQQTGWFFRSKLTERVITTTELFKNELQLVYDYMMRELTSIDENDQM
jgi:hypothetical protein